MEDFTAGERIKKYLRVSSRDIEYGQKPRQEVVVIRKSSALHAGGDRICR
jgi:RNase P protein component